MVQYEDQLLPVCKQNFTISLSPRTKELLPSTTFAQHLVNNLKPLFHKLGHLENKLGLFKTVDSIYFTQT